MVVGDQERSVGRRWVMSFSIHQDLDASLDASLLNQFLGLRRLLRRDGGNDIGDQRETDTNNHQ